VAVSELGLRWRRALPIWAAPAATAACALGACVLLRVRDPREDGAYGICPWLLLTGTWCPGCGSLRALDRLLAGDVRGASGYNVLTLLTLPVLVYAWLAWALPASVTRHWPRVGHAPSRAIRALAVLVVAYWVARNLPWAPFTLLAPGP
jgi:hypothetical protein